ncbi:MetQ/NlpA family ABC transporter substrate-binding protein [Paenibacillus sinopodophylli]|uniref:MetQ/NlpA family ABC transporter substrate-binding protein n=1 Tax=Paenibacillus sinopodophylli TaxID=1837342 RepID=UPI00110CCCBD|nr:MetQ/NlpA family ABC transporter substrate-binding protein [Paenibacillus sinopodophylli]
MKQKLLLIMLTLVLTTVLAACGSNKAESNDSTAEGEKAKLKVGISAGVEEEIWKQVQEVAAKDNLEIELVVFNDYVQPNKVLAEGELDANAFQHEPYLDQFKKDNNLDLVKIANTLNFPIGFYSEKIKEVSEIKEGDVIGLPNDPTNGARALILFENAGLIKLKEGAGITATVRDIAENKLNLKFEELDAAFIPKALGDLTAAVINTNYAVEAGFVPTQDAIFIEPKDSPWVNIIAVRTEDKDKPVFQRLIKAYHSDQVKKYVEEKYGSYIVASW